MDWIRGQAIGHGSFSTVSLAIPRSSDSQLPLMAVKSSDLNDSSLLRNEKQVLDQLNGCPEVVRCLGDDYSCDEYHVFLEYADAGDLADRVRKSGGGLPESDVRRYTKSILEGLRYIHERGLVHCDVKLQNILLFTNGGKDSAKIADFGLAKKRGEVNRGGERRVEIRGTPLYMSPESVNDGVYESPVDIWALGCAVVEMVTGKPAWKWDGRGNVMAFLMRIGVGNEFPEIPGELSEEGKDFLRKCFAKDPEKRWSAEMLLDHPFVAGKYFPDSDETSFSPRDPFALLDWNSISSSVSLSPQIELFDEECVMDRLRALASKGEPDWGASCNWITVR